MRHAILLDHLTPGVVTVLEYVYRPGFHDHPSLIHTNIRTRLFYEANMVAMQASDGKYKLVKNRYAINADHEAMRFSNITAMIHYMNAFLAEAEQPLIKHIDFTCTTTVRVPL
ncbi:hypothetical protein VPHK567_0142 [Vibrio phage K567]